MLCDGTHGTPDLRSRFVYGAGDDVNTKPAFGIGWNVINGHWHAGVTGGEESHQLTIAEMPSHNHFGTITGFTGDTSYSSLRSLTAMNNMDWWGFTITTINEPLVGGNQAHNNLPPFLTLCYIMKI